MTQKRLKNTTGTPLGLPVTRPAIVVPPNDSVPLPAAWDLIKDNGLVKRWLQAGSLVIEGGKSQHKPKGDETKDAKSEDDKPKGDATTETKGTDNDGDENAGSGAQGTAGERPRTPVSDEGLKILDNSIAEIERQLPGLTNEQFDQVIQAEKDGKTRAGLVGEGRVFDQEWKRRYGSDG